LELALLLGLGEMTQIKVSVTYFITLSTLKVSVTYLVKPSSFQVSITYLSRGGGDPPPGSVQLLRTLPTPHNILNLINYTCNRKKVKKILKLAKKLQKIFRKFGEAGSRKSHFDRKIFMGKHLTV
jgi:hypothetical protein